PGIPPANPGTPPANPGTPSTTPPGTLPGAPSSPSSPAAPVTPPSAAPSSPSLPATPGAIIASGADLGSNEPAAKHGGPEIFLPTGQRVGKAGETMLVDLGGFIGYHSPRTIWTITVDWGDGTSTRRTTPVTGGLGAWPHTYAQPGA